MELLSIAKKTKLVSIRLNRMSESKVIIGVLAGGWLDLSATGGWIRISDMFIRMRHDKGKVDVAMLVDDVSLPLFKYAAERNYLYTTDCMNSEGDITYRKQQAERIRLPVNRGQYYVATWKVDDDRIWTLAENAKRNMIREHRTMFSKIKNQL